MMIGIIFIYKRDCLKFEIEIYYQIISVIIKSIYKSLFLYIVVRPEIALEKIVIESLLKICPDENIQKCHPIL